MEMFPSTANSFAVVSELLPASCTNPSIYNLLHSKNSSSHYYKMNVGDTVELRFFEVKDECLIETHAETVEEQCLGSYTFVIRDTEVLSLRGHVLSWYNFSTERLFSFEGFRRLCRYPVSHTHYAHLVYNGKHVIVDVQEELIVKEVRYQDCVEDLFGENQHYTIVKVYDHPLYKDLIVINASMYLVGMNEDGAVVAHLMSFKLPKDIIIKCIFSFEDEFYFVDKNFFIFKLSKKGNVFDTALASPGKTANMCGMIRNLSYSSGSVRLYIEHVPETTLLTITDLMTFVPSASEEVPVLRSHGYNVFFTPWLNTVHIFAASPHFSTSHALIYSNSLVSVGKDNYIRIIDGVYEVINTITSQVLHSATFDQDLQGTRILGSEYGIVVLTEKGAIASDGTEIEEEDGFWGSYIFGNICYLCGNSGVVLWKFEDGRVVDTMEFDVDGENSFTVFPNRHNPNMMFLEEVDDMGEFCNSILKVKWDAGVLVHPIEGSRGTSYDTLINFIDENHLIIGRMLFKYCDDIDEVVNVSSNFPIDPFCDYRKSMFFSGKPGVLYHMKCAQHNFNFVYDVIKYNAKENIFSHTEKKVNIIEFVRNADIEYHDGFLYYRIY
ncbi:hypothetical protein PCE1_000253 [Barthelona sp. PCE]